MLFYVNATASYSVCVFYVNASHFVSVFYVNAIVILFVNVMVEKYCNLSIHIFVNVGNFVNVLEKELLQTKYPYL